MTEPSPPPAPASSPMIEDKAVRRVMRWIPLAMAGHLLIGAPALLISLVVAYGTYVQANATQKMQTAAAWPYVSYGTSNLGDGRKEEYSFTLTNDGVGPAMLSAVEVRYEGRIMRNASQLFTACCRSAGGSLRAWWSPPSGSVLRPGDKVEFLHLEQSLPGTAAGKRILGERMKIDVRACYCSIFDDCWIMSGMQTRPKPVAACPTDWTRFG